jgi:hypothetical protein
MEKITCDHVQYWLSKSAQPKYNTFPSPALCAHIEQCAACRGTVLAVVAQGVGILPMTVSTSCQSCAEDLAAFVEQEIEDAISAACTYPHVWWHLWVCAECAKTYRLTRVLVEAERNGRLAPPPFPQIMNSSQTRPLGIMHLTRQFLNHAMPASVLLDAVRRGVKDSPMVLAEDDDTEGYAVSFSVQRQSDGAWSMMVTAVPPPVGRLVLALGPSTFYGRFDGQGVALVTDVPAALLAASDGPDLIVGIEPGE